MSYALNTSLSLGSSKTGLADLRAQLLDSIGVNSGSPISTGFVEIGNGHYLWSYNGFADNFRGGVKFYSNASPSILLGFIAINPEEGENLNAKISTRSTLTNLDIESILTTYDVATANDVLSVAQSLSVTNSFQYSSENIFIKQASTLSVQFNNITIMPSNWTKCIFTAKSPRTQEIIIKVIKSNPSSGSDGLVIVNNLAFGYPAYGSMTVNYIDKIVTLIIADDATALLEEGKHNYDLKFIDADSKSVSIETGIFYVKKGVTLDI